MDSADFVFWFCALFNALVSIALAWRTRLTVKAGALAETSAKTGYSFGCVAVGIFSGMILFNGITSLFKVSTGHGEILVAAPLFNLLLSGVLIIAGQIVIGWKPMKW